MPEVVRGLYEARSGFANYHFAIVERDRVAQAIATSAAGLDQGPWVLAGRLAEGGEFRIEISDSQGLIDLPTGTSVLDANGSLDTNPVPPGSGGMLAALMLWRRLVTEGPAALGGTTYQGTAPRDPSQLDPAGRDLVDVLASAVAGVEARFSVDASGHVCGIDLWTSPEADPCEIRILACEAGDAGGALQRLEVHRGPDPFGTFLIETLEPAGVLP